MADQNKLMTTTIGQMTPMDPELLSGEDSIEITVTTRSDGGNGLAKKTYRTTLNAVLSLYARRRDNPNEVTAAQVGTYTVAEITALLESKLGVEGVAVNALRLEGYTRQEIIEQARAGTVENARHLGGLPASDYLQVNDFETALVRVKESIDELTEAISE